jgi:hypothetical protein
MATYFAIVAPFWIVSSSGCAWTRSRRSSGTEVTVSSLGPSPDAELARGRTGEEVEEARRAPERARGRVSRLETR